MIKAYHSRILTTLLALAASFAPVQAQDVTGLQLIATPSQTTATVLDLEALDAFEQISFATSTLWTNGTPMFSGVPLKTLLDHFGATGSQVKMTALNDYFISMPLAELKDEVPIVATRIDGKPIPVRDKGPFWIVYPYDSHREYRSETTYARSIWQLYQLTMLD